MWVALGERLDGMPPFSARGIDMGADAAYFRRRSREEREAALKAAHPKAREAHLELADAYEYRASAFAAEEQRIAALPIIAA
jgi:hypothetical protein